MIPFVDFQGVKLSSMLHFFSLTQKCNFKEKKMSPLPSILLMCYTG